MTERPGRQPFDAQRNLLAAGVTLPEISTIKEQARLARSGSDAIVGAGGFYDFFAGSRGLLSGNYQDGLAADLGFPRPSITVPTTRTKERGIGRWKREINIPGTEDREIFPVDSVAYEITRYALDLIEKGVEPVTLVDFGAGSSGTFAEVAHLLKEQTRAGKTRIITTNVDKAPTHEDIPEIESRFGYTHALNVVEALQEGTATFAAADSYELYDLLRGGPIHLLFMFNVLDKLDIDADKNMKILGSMLDPRYGTAAISYVKSPYSDVSQSVGRGYEGWEQRGFIQRHPLQVAEGILHDAKPIGEFPYTIYQAPEAPHFALYRLGSGPLMP